MQKHHLARKGPKQLKATMRMEEVEREEKAKKERKERKKERKRRNKLEDQIFCILSKTWLYFKGKIINVCFFMSE